MLDGGLRLRVSLFTGLILLQDGACICQIIMPDLPGEVEQSRDHNLQREFADLKFSLQEVVC